MAAKGSERLIIFLLKARRPHVYRERILPQAGSGEAVVFKMVVGENEGGACYDAVPAPETC